MAGGGGRGGNYIGPDQLAAQQEAAAEAARVKAEEEDRLRREQDAMMRGLRGRRALLSTAGETGYPTLGGGGPGALVPGA